MKQTFIHEFQGGALKEKLEIDVQPNHIYLAYSKGTYTKTAYLLKTQGKTDEAYLREFYEQNHVSSEIVMKVNKYRNAVLKGNEQNMHQFILFLVLMLSMNSVLLLLVGAFTYGGYWLGAKLDDALSLFPLFTIMFVFLGITIGGVVSFFMVQKYLKQQKEGESA